VQDAAVLGKTFTRRGLAALSALSEEAIEPLVTPLLRKEILYLETDARSAERGQLDSCGSSRVHTDTVAA
jgi:hypothetical protein